MLYAVINAFAGPPLSPSALVVQPGQNPQWAEFNAGPYDGSNDIGIAVGQDKNLWFTDAGGSIGKITTAGVITKYPLTLNNVPLYIVPGPKQSLWFTEYLGYIGKVSLSGAITEYLIPIPNERTNGITIGPDRNIWFSEEQPGAMQPQIGRMTPAGKFLTSFPVNGSGLLAKGPDGRVWATEQNRSDLVAITPAGQETHYGGLTEPAVDVAGGPDGNIWFTENDYVGFMTTSGVVTEYSEPSSLGIDQLAFGADRTAYFTCELSPYIGRITRSGSTQFYKNPFGGQGLGVVSGPDRNIWFDEIGENIGVFIRLVMTVNPSSIAFTSVGQIQTITVSEKHYGGGWTATSLNPAVATVTQDSSNTFTVTAAGSGSTSIDVADTVGNDFLVSVSVP